MTITLVATPDPPDYDPQTPIFARLMAERDHRRPGTLTEDQEAEMREYAAQVAQQKDPQILYSRVLDELGPKKAARAIPVVPLAARLPDPEPIPDGDPVPAPGPEDPEDALEASGTAPQGGEAPEVPEDSPEAATALLERVVPDVPDAE